MRQESSHCHPPPPTPYPSRVRPRSPNKEKFFAHFLTILPKSFFFTYRANLKRGKSPFVCQGCKAQEIGFFFSLSCQRTVGRSEQKTETNGFEGLFFFSSSGRWTAQKQFTYRCVLCCTYWAPTWSNEEDHFKNRRN